MQRFSGRKYFAKGQESKKVCINAQENPDQLDGMGSITPTRDNIAYNNPMGQEYTKSLYW
jgi:hypothetical protein